MAHALNPETPATAASQAARAWDVLEDRKRVFKMQPKPRDLDTTAQPKRPAKSPTVLTFTEPPNDAKGISLTGKG